MIKFKFQTDICQFYPFARNILLIVENGIHVISSILIPTDFSPASWNATQLGLELSRLNVSTRLSFLHVYPVSPKYIDKAAIEANSELLEVMKSRMNELSHSLTEKPEDLINNIVLSGNVDEVMLQFIKENDFDLIIVGINGNGQNNELGSHTIRVIRESGVPVMIVPNKSDDGGFRD